MCTPGVVIELEYYKMPSTPDVKTLTFTGNECRKFRFFLRLLSLWRPCTAGFVERIVYPLLINVLLLVSGPVRNVIRANMDPTWLSVQFIYITHELSLWLGHILGNVYFRTRDLETNVLPDVQLLTGSKTSLKRRLRYLDNLAVVVLVVFCVTLSTVFVVTQAMNNPGAEQFSSFLPHVHGAMDNILYVLIVISITYYIGVGIALAWTMGFLYVCFESRLQTLEGVYLRWKKPMQDAVYVYQQCYSWPLKRSWKRLSWWFLAHNMIVLAVPLYGYKLAQAFSGDAYDVRHVWQFIVYVVFVLFVWLTPTFMAEKIKKRETRFRDTVNDFCPGLLEDVLSGDDHAARVTLPWVSEARASFRGKVKEKQQKKKIYGTLDRVPPGGMEIKQDDISVSSDTSADEAGAENNNSYTFASRGDDLAKFLRFLRDTRPSLASRGYTYQLLGSFFSIVLGILSFLITLHKN